MVKPYSKCISRAELYDQVWSAPMRQIASRFGISDVGLRKICDKKGIPLPRAGYWMKLKHGKKVSRRPALPPSSGGSEQIMITRFGVRTADLDATLPDDIASSVAALRAGDEPLPMPQRIRPHPLIAKLATEDRSRPKPIEFRRRRFLNFLFAEVERRGGSVASGERHGYKITIAGEPLDVTVREPWRMKGEQPTDQERRKAWAEGRSATSDPTGSLQLLIESWFSTPTRKQWRDGKDNPLENQVRSILIGFLISASFERKTRLEREEEHRRRVIAEEQRAALEDRQRKEKERVDAFLREVSAWEQAARIRRYVEARLAAVGKDGESAQAREWAEWARLLADRLDPISARQ